MSQDVPEMLDGSQVRCRWWTVKHDMEWHTGLPVKLARWEAAQSRQSATDEMKMKSAIQMDQSSMCSYHKHRWIVKRLHTSCLLSWWAFCRIADLSRADDSCTGTHESGGEQEHIDGVCSTTQIILIQTVAYVYHCPSSEIVITVDEG